jgi:hypothetical protein
MKTSESQNARDPLTIACELVGRYQYHFARIDRALDAGLVKVLNLNEAAANVLIANIDFYKKTNIIKAVVQLQFVDKDGAIESLLNRIRGVNSPDRQTVIHSTFEPQGTNAVKFRRLVAKDTLDVQEPVWTDKEFSQKYSQLENLAVELERLIESLEPYTPSLDFSDGRNSTFFVFGF